MNDTEYQVYLDKVTQYLESHEVRLLTEKEEEIVVAHLQVVASTFCHNHENKRNDADKYAGLGITQVLSIETALKVSELHEDFSNPTPEAYDRRVAEVLAVQNYLKSGKLTGYNIEIANE